MDSNMLSWITGVLLSSVIGLLVYIWKFYSAKINKISLKLDKINPELLVDVKKDLKALLTFTSHMDCPGILKCKKIFVEQRESITPELLKLTILKAFSLFELKLVKEGYFSINNNNKIK